MEQNNNEVVLDWTILTVKQNCNEEIYQQAMLFR